MELRNKKVLVMGLGLHGGGVGTIRFLQKMGAQMTVTDLRPKKTLAPSLKLLRDLKDIRYVLGRHRQKDVLEANLIIKNPGVKPDSPFLKLAYKNKISVTTDLGIFFKICRAPVIGVTGTRGKSTTAYLITEFLRKGTGRRVFLGGNIRKSVLEFVQNVKSSDLVVLELSSFQLEDLSHEGTSPHIAVFTNIYRDHLNWHKSMADYMRAKSHIFAYQNPRDYLIASREDKEVMWLAKRAKSKVIFPRLDKKFTKLVEQKLGSHYKSSVALAIAVAKLYKVSDQTIKKVLQDFRGLEGRQEHIATVREVTFINDTTATIPDAAIAAMKRFYAPAKKLILITGGQDKVLKFGEMVKALKKFPDYTIFLPGTATQKLIKSFRGQTQTKKQSRTYTENKKIFHVQSMKEAVGRAWSLAKPGDIILLSPGAASFGLFLNEFDRGRKFMEEVRKLKF